LETALEYGVSNFVFSSSCTVYGEPETLPVDESFPVLPATSPYGNTKQMAEEIIRDTVASGEKLKALSLRYFNPVGSHESAEIGEHPVGVPGNLIPFVMQTAAGWREKLSVFGDDYDTPDGTCIRDYIHVVDLAKAHVHALQYLINQPTESLYDWVNLGTGQGNSVMEVIKTFERVSGKKLNYQITNRRPGDVIKIYAATEKAERVLVGKPKKHLKMRWLIPGDGSKNWDPSHHIKVLKESGFHYLKS
jgi:UDP-glucose 4-epimerase